MPPAPLPCPAGYEIVVSGELDPLWAAWFEPLHMQAQAGRTRLSGPLADQTALRTVLWRLFDLNLTLLSLRRSDA